MIEPTEANLRTEEEAGCATFNERDVEMWRTHGYCLVNGVFPDDLLLQAKSDALSKFPKAGSPEARLMNDFGGGAMTFPSIFNSINQIALHSRLIRGVSQLLGIPISELRMTQAEMWPKYGKEEGELLSEFDNQDQRIHVDYPNHTLTHPPTWNEPDAVEFILYLDNETECGGATAVVPRLGEEDPAYIYQSSRHPVLAI